MLSLVEQTKLAPKQAAYSWFKVFRFQVTNRSVVHDLGTAGGDGGYLERSRAHTGRSFKLPMEKKKPLLSGK